MTNIEKSMKARGLKNEADLNKLFARRYLNSSKAAQAALANRYIKECVPEIGEHIWGVIIYMDSETKPTFYGVQLDDEQNTLVYCRKNGSNINEFLDMIGQMNGDMPESWYKEHRDHMPEYMERRSERAREYLLWRPQKGCEVQLLIVGKDEDTGLYFGVLELPIAGES